MIQYVTFASPPQDLTDHLLPRWLRHDPPFFASHWLILIFYRNLYPNYHFHCLQGSVKSWVVCVSQHGWIIDETRWFLYEKNLQRKVIGLHFIITLFFFLFLICCASACFLWSTVQQTKALSKSKWILIILPQRFFLSHF